MEDRNREKLKEKNNKYILLEESLRALRKKSINLICLSGSAGFGKSYRTLKYLEDKKVDYCYLNTYSSPLAFYKNLYLNKDKEIIVFDDVQNIDNNIIIAILKSACWGILDDKRVLGWHTTSENFNKLNIEEEFVLNANIILIFNDPLQNFKPIINRSINIDFYFSFEEKIKIFEELGMDEEIIKYVKLNCSDATDNLSIRTLKILSNLKKDNFNWRMFAGEMLKSDAENELILKLLTNCHTVRDASSEWTKLTGKSQRTFFRYYSKLKQKDF